MSDPLVKAGLAELDYTLSSIEKLMVDAVIQRLDHPALPNLRAAYLAVQDSHNQFDVAQVRGGWASDVMSPEAETAMREALDDLWACIGSREIDQLHESTVRVAKANHELLWHRPTDEELEASPT